MAYFDDSDNIERVWEYCGRRVAYAELVAAIDFGTPQIVSRAIVDETHRRAFNRGVSDAYANEAVTLERWAATTHGWASSFYRLLCREVGV